MFKEGCALYYFMAELRLVVVNKHNTARVASCWFIYRLVMYGNSYIKFCLDPVTIAIQPPFLDQKHLNTLFQIMFFIVSVRNNRNSAQLAPTEVFAGTDCCVFYIKTWDGSLIEEFTIFLRDLHYCCYFMGSFLSQGIAGVVTRQKTAKKMQNFELSYL